MELFETRAFRLILTVITIITLFFAMRQCASDSSTGGETREDASVETTDDAEIPDLELATREADQVIAQTTPVASQPTNILIYPIESGDTLNAIAIRFNVSIDVILRSNPNLDASNLQIGQKIKLPGAALDSTALENPSTEREDGASVDYFIEEGDTLGLIAEAYTVTLEALLGANPGLDPAALAVGAKVVVPPFGSGFDPADLTPVPTITPIPREIGEPLTYFIQSGDTLASLAARYGVTTNALMSANAIDDANNIFIGQELLIPPPA